MRLSSQTIRRLSLFFVVSTFCYSGLLYFFFIQARAFAFAEGEKQVQNVLLTHKAIHAFVEKVQKPAIYQLKQEGHLYTDYFNPKLLSRTYIARGIEQYLSEERAKAGLAPLYFKLATDNPRNKLNDADSQELDLLRQMRAGLVTKYSEIVEVNGQYSLYYAIPVEKIVSSCLQCHGDPQLAPQELVAQYGPTKAFHEAVGDLRALISIRVPLDAQFKAAQLIFIRLSAGTGLLLLLLLALVSFFVVKIERHQQIIVDQNKALQRLATIDMLTGIYNRQGFMTVMTQELAAGQRHDLILSLIMMDLDFFKEINDTYGHAVGDAVLTAIGQLLTAVRRTSDIVARWGGEEFVIVCPHTELEGAVKLAEKIQSHLASQDFFMGIRMTASFGVAQYQTQDTVEQLVNRADAALYLSKDQGRNLICRAVQDS